MVTPCCQTGIVFLSTHVKPHGRLRENYSSHVMTYFRSNTPNEKGLPLRKYTKSRLLRALYQMIGGKQMMLRFLAHLSQRLIGELIGYSWSGVRPSSVVVRRPSSVVNNFKRLLLQNRLPDQCQILCGASLGRGNESLFAASGSHDQDGRQAHIW